MVANPLTQALNEYTNAEDGDEKLEAARNLIQELAQFFDIEKTTYQITLKEEAYLDFKKDGLNWDKFKADLESAAEANTGSMMTVKLFEFAMEERMRAATPPPRNNGYTTLPNVEPASPTMTPVGFSTGVIMQNMSIPSLPPLSPMRQRQVDEIKSMIERSENLASIQAKWNSSYGNIVDYVLIEEMKDKIDKVPGLENWLKDIQAARIAESNAERQQHEERNKKAEKALEEYNKRKEFNDLSGKCEAALRKAIKSGDKEQIVEVIRDPKYSAVVASVTTEADFAHPSLNLRDLFSFEVAVREEYRKPQPDKKAILEWAVKYNQTGVVEQMARDQQLAVDDLNALDKTGGSVLHRAVSNQNSGMVAVLLHSGADVNLQMEKPSNPLIHKKTPLHLAFQRYEQTPGRSAIDIFVALANLLIEKGANVDVKDAEGKTFRELLDGVKESNQQLKRLYASLQWKPAAKRSNATASDAGVAAHNRDSQGAKPRIGAARETTVQQPEVKQEEGVPTTRRR